MGVSSTTTIEVTPKMALSDSAIRTAKAKSAPYKLFDEGGLFLIVTPALGKLWRLKYRYHGKEQQLSLGTYPTVGLKAARKKRDEAKELLDQGVDPRADKKRKAVAAVIAAGNTFKSVADEFVDKIERDGRAKATVVKTRWLAAQLEPDLGASPVADIQPVEVLTVLKRIERKGNHESAKRVCEFASRVFKYAIITGRASNNPAAYLGAALVSPKVKHHAAIIEPKAVGELLRSIDNLEGFTTTKLALKILPHLFVRPGELRHAEWVEFDFDAKVWRIPAAKMKMRGEHVVPLSRQSFAILEEVREITGCAKYVFPSIRSNHVPMSENTINVVLRRLGYTSDEMTAHGFRSTASTLLNESGLWSSDAIEHALAHKDTNKVRAAYHRGKHWDERVRMAQWWSDYLDKLRIGGQVVPLKAG